MANPLINSSDYVYKWSSNKKKLLLHPKLNMEKRGKREQVLCKENYLYAWNRFKNTKIDKICYAVLVQNCIAHTILLMVNPNKKNVVEETENNHNK